MIVLIYCVIIYKLLELFKLICSCYEKEEMNVETRGWRVMITYYTYFYSYKIQNKTHILCALKIENFTFEHSLTLKISTTTSASLKSLIGTFDSNCKKKSSHMNIFFLQKLDFLKTKTKKHVLRWLAVSISNTSNRVYNALFSNTTTAYTQS